MGEELVLFIVVIIVIYCLTYWRRPHSRPMGPPDSTPYGALRGPPSPLRSRPNSGNVRFAEDVSQRRYSKRTGRILGDSLVSINDLM